MSKQVKVVLPISKADMGMRVDATVTIHNHKSSWSDDKVYKISVTGKCLWEIIEEFGEKNIKTITVR